MGIGILDERWKVNGTTIYRPSLETKIKHSSVKSNDSGKTEDGVQHNTWLRRDVVTISLAWDALTGNELSTLVQLMQGREFVLTYPEYGQTHTATVEVEEIPYTSITDDAFPNEGGLCTGITATAVEL